MWCLVLYTLAYCLPNVSSFEKRKKSYACFYTQFTPFPTDVKKTVRENAGNFDRFSKKTMEEGIEVRILLC